MKKLILLAIILMPLAIYCQIDTTVQQVKEVSVNYTKKKEVAFEDEKYFIIDFHIDSNATFLLVSNRRNYFIYSLNSLMQTEHKLKLKFHPKSLYLDCLGNTHIIARDSMYQLEKINNQGVITHRNSIMLYHRYFKDCVADNDSFVIFKTHQNYNQSLSYYGLAKDKHLRQEVYRIEDSLLVKSANEEARKIREERGSSGSHTGEIQKEQIREMREKEQRAMFFEHIVKRKKYHPLFVHEDTTYIFDHLNNECIQLNASNEILKRIPIEHHEHRNWHKRVQFDQIRHNFYSVEIKHGAEIMVRLDKSSLKPTQKTKITKHPYPRKVLIYNGFAYYTYKPNYDANLNKLYRQRL